MFTQTSDFARSFDHIWRLWHAARNGSDIPYHTVFDAMAYAEYACETTWVEVQRQPRLDFRFRRIGTHIDARMRENYNGKRLSAFARSAPGTNIWSAYEDTVRSRSPLILHLPYIGEIEGITHTCELFLPFHDDSTDVSHVLVAIEFMGDSAVSMSQTRWT